jgi:hypothetical protein
MRVVGFSIRAAIFRLSLGSDRSSRLRRATTPTARSAILSAMNSRIFTPAVVKPLNVRTRSTG